MMDTKCLRRFSFVSHKFPSQSGSYKLQSRPGEKKNNLFAKCNFLHDWWLPFLSLGAWKFSIKLSKRQKWSTATGMQPVITRWPVRSHWWRWFVQRWKKLNGQKLKCIQIFVIITSERLLKWWRPTKVCVGDCVSCFKRIFKQFLVLCEPSAQSQSWRLIRAVR